MTPDHITEAMRSIFRFLWVTQLRTLRGQNVADNAPSRDYTVARTYGCTNTNHRNCSPQALELPDCMSLYTMCVYIYMHVS